MRTRALPLALLAAAALGAPAHAAGCGPDGCPSPSAGGPEPYRECASIVAAQPLTVTARAGAPVTLSFANDVAGRHPAYDWTLVRTAPAASATVRTVPSSGGASFTVAVPVHHVFTVRAVNTVTRCVSDLPGVRVLVTPVLSLSARRLGPREYAFTGRVLPGRGQAVTLHRVQSDGVRVVTARTTVRPDGTYRVVRCFPGSGRHAFAVTVGASASHTAGSSPVRPTVVH